MISFKNLEGMEGIDKLNECAPLINDIFGDNEIFNNDTDVTWGELATPIYKKHPETINKIFEILGEAPKSAAGILSGVSRLLIEVTSDKEVASFFMGTAKNLRSWISAMANTEGEQSKAT